MEKEDSELCKIKKKYLVNNIHLSVNWVKLKYIADGLCVQLPIIDLYATIQLLIIKIQGQDQKSNPKICT